MKDFPIVGIGASAGGLEAISKLLNHLSVDTGMAYVIIQHLERTHESHLAEILSRNTKLPVKEITNKMRIEPNHIYTIPPNCAVALSNYTFNLSSRSGVLGQSIAIDFFFVSLAENKKNRAIGIILSGTATDGTNGLKAIKSAGGTTFAQDPQTSKFDGMPRSAIASGVVDLVLSPEEIATELMRMAKHPYIKASEVEGGDIETYSEPGEALRKIFSLLRTHTQVEFSSYKPTTVKRRIERQMMLHKIVSIEKYANYLKTSPESVKALYEDIFIHVTEFFRDPHSFDSLQSHVFPLLVKNNTLETPIRIWVPGCSTGEEVYSLAISLFEFLVEKKISVQLQIFATDISELAIQTARKGIYTAFQVRGVSEERLNRFFDKISEGYKIKKIIRDNCIFSRHDLITT